VVGEGWRCGWVGAAEVVSTGMIDLGLVRPEARLQNPSEQQIRASEFVPSIPSGDISDPRAPGSPICHVQLERIGSDLFPKQRRAANQLERRSHSPTRRHDPTFSPRISDEFPTSTTKTCTATMVSLDAVKQSNADLKDYGPGLVGVFGALRSAPRSPRFYPREREREGRANNRGQSAEQAASAKRPRARL
jgi:hypothetical protein